MNEKILMVAVHPDDETLGCGGTLLKHKQNGDEIHWLICTSLEKDHEAYEKREHEIDSVSSAYGFDSTCKLGLKTTQVDEYSVSDLVQKFSEAIKRVRPDTIYMPFKSDVHSDHRIIFDSVFSCTKVFRYPFVKRIYMCETLSETEFAPATKEDSFIPNVFVNISDFIEKKIDIMKFYRGELGKHPFPRSERNIRALATFRGATAGCEYAESFMLVKEVIQ